MNRRLGQLHRAFKSPVSAPLGYLPPLQAGDRAVALSCCGDINANVILRTCNYTKVFHAFAINGGQ